MLKRWIWIVATLFALSLVPANALAQRGSRGGGSRASTPRASATRASGTSRSYSGSARSSRGYYRGPAKPSGTFKNGQGSSHKGGTYKNDNTQDRYQKQPNKQP